MLNWKTCSTEERRLADIIHLIFKPYPELEQFLFNAKTPNLNEPPEFLLAQIGAFSSGEQVLIRVVLDLWSGEGDTPLFDIIHRLDDRNFTHVMAALLYLRLPQLDSLTLNLIRAMIYDK
jgi:hypothetical protein